MNPAKSARRQKLPGKSEPGTSGKRRLGRLLDEQWLEKSVRDMYREVVEEPIPEALLKILDRVAKRDS